VTDGPTDGQSCCLISISRVSIAEKCVHALKGYELEFGAVGRCNSVVERPRDALYPSVSFNCVISPAQSFIIVERSNKVKPFRVSRF